MNRSKTARRSWTARVAKPLNLKPIAPGSKLFKKTAHGEGLTVAEAVASYLKDMKPPQREPKTYMAYKYCLELFASNCAKRFVLDVKREDLLAFIRKLYELKCGPRTAYNRAVIVSQLLKTQRHHKAAPQSRLAGIR